MATEVVAAVVATEVVAAVEKEVQGWAQAEPESALVAEEKEVQVAQELAQAERVLVRAVVVAVAAEAQAGSALA